MHQIHWKVAEFVEMLSQFSCAVDNECIEKEQSHL
jgi:hypothetical protein